MKVLICAAHYYEATSLFFIMKSILILVAFIEKVQTSFLDMMSEQECIFNEM
jgi:hypothetical protein